MIESGAEIRVRVAAWPDLLWVLLALAVGLSGILVLPPDEHEVLVLRSTQEMLQRGDWVVPYFNGEPRLNKPPLNYWATGIVAGLSGSLESVQPWHGTTQRGAGRHCVSRA